MLLRPAALLSTFRAAIRHLGIEAKQITPRGPGQNGVAERFVGTVRRELLDHAIVLDHRPLQRLLQQFAARFHEDRTHLGLGGLHRRYGWRDAA